MPNSHPENFPVASWLLPQRLRAPVAAIYRFARSADDIADEGTADAVTRMAQLKAYDNALTAIESGRPLSAALSPIFAPLARLYQQTHLPLAPCHALLSAFMQDVRQTRYATYADLLDYCARSANPIGHLMLALFEADTPDNRDSADAICTALQLTNHWQDIAIDATKGSEGRIYLPQDELAHWGYSDADILSGTAQSQSPLRWAEFMQFQIQRVAALYTQGEDLPYILGKKSWRIGRELSLTLAGGRRILDKISTVNGDVFRHRPTLGWQDWLRILIH